MIRKLIIRSFLACCALFLFVVSAICLCFWLVIQEPSFYAELKKQTFTQTDREAVEDRLSSQMASTESWVRSSVHGNVKRETETSDESRANKIRKLVISQNDLNATFSSRRYSMGDFRNPRAQIVEGKIRFGAELYVSDESPIVVSLDCKLSRVVDDKLKIEMIGGGLGRLPVPLQWILNNLPENVLRSTKKCEFHFSEPTPYILLTISDSSHSDPVLTQVTTANGEITLEISPPVVAF